MRPRATAILLGAIVIAGCMGRPHTPLTKAAAAGDVAAFRRLLAEGAQPDEAGGHGLAALHHAARGGHLPVLELLLKAGAPGGMTALWSAAGGGAIADITDGPPLGTCFPDTIKLLLERAPDLRLSDDAWTKSVLWLAKTDECKAVSALVGKG